MCILQISYFLLKTEVDVSDLKFAYCFWEFQPVAL
jgi:hypothetical protein